jgi:2-polyprenyl-3-methyl-5-hydroxy-6-metoxy-1,4-benzoquinol methylase
VSLASISSGLTLGSDGIWRSGRREQVSYPDGAHLDYAAIEDRSFWFRHRNRCIAALLEAHPPDGALFDVGGGNGFVAAGLMQAGFEVVLVEPGEDGAMAAKRRGVPNVVCATTETAGFQPRCMPAIGLFDVVEHVEDDVGMLRHLAGLLRDDGMVYLTVPAYAWLWSEEDERAGHFRRYDMPGFLSVLRAAALTPVFATHFFRPLPAPILMLRTLPHRLGLRGRGDSTATVSRDHAAKAGLMGAAFERLLGGETENIRRSRPMAFGGSLLVAARKTLG